MLFKPETNKNQSHEEVLSFIDTDGVDIMLNEEIEKDLDKAIGPLIDGANYHYSTANTWNLHELLIYCALQAAPCNLYFTAYSIKEQAARAITSLYHSGHIKEIHVLLDSSAEKHCEPAIQILKMVTDQIKYTEVHAKCIVLDGNLSVSITGSQNFTRNKRLEMGVITVNKNVATYRKNVILKQMKNGFN